MANITKKLLVDIETRLRGSKNVDKFRQSLTSLESKWKSFSQTVGAQAAKQDAAIQKLADKNEALRRISSELGLTIQQVRQAMSRLGYSFNKTGQIINATGDQVNRFRGDIARTASQMKPFRMELLSVMFAGMALQRVVSGLIRKSMEWYGVWDILSTALGILFMPVAETLLNWALRFLNWVSTLDPETKKLIGVFAILAGAMGTLLMIIGQVALGINGLIQLFGPIFTSIKHAGGLIKWLTGGMIKLGSAIMGIGKAILGFFAGLSAPILAIIALILAAVIGIYLGWRDNILNMREIVSEFFDGVKRIFSGFFQFFKGFFQIIGGIFTLNFEMIKEGVKNIFLGLGNFLIGLWKTIVNGIIAVIFGLVIFGKKVVDMIFDFFGWLYDKLVGHSIIPDMVNAIIEWFKMIPGKILDAFKSLAIRIKDALMNIIPDWMIDLFKKGISIGSSMLSGAKGLLGSFQSGGVIPQTGPYLLHEGETVVPTGQGGNVTNNMAPNITVNATVSSEIDIRSLAERIKREWVSDYERLNKRS